MDSKGTKIKGAITSFLSVALSLDGVLFFSFFAFFKRQALVPFLFAATYFLFEAAGRAYALSFTLANRHKQREEAKEKKAQLALMMGIAETLYAAPWILAVFCCPSLSFSEMGFAPLLFLLSKISAEAVLSCFRFFPYQKNRICLASESLCAFCFACSFFLALLLSGLSKEGKLGTNAANVLSGAFFLVFFLIQNVLFSILLLKGEAIARIKEWVTFGMRHGIGNYIVVTSSLMTVFVSSVSAVREKNFAYAGIALIYLSLGAIRLSALLWKNAIHRNVYNKRLAEAKENKILFYVGALLAGLSAIFSCGIFWISRQEFRQSAAIVLIFQILHGLFRLFLCIKNYVSFQKQNKPFSIAVSSLDMLIGVYSLFSIFLLINLYFNFAWVQIAISVLSWMTFGGTVALGLVMAVLGAKGIRQAERLSKEIKANAERLRGKLDQFGLDHVSFSRDARSKLLEDSEFRSILCQTTELGPSSLEEEKFLIAFQNQIKEETKSS